VDFLTKNHKNLNNMTIFQTTFDIPDWILQGLQTGEYVRIGGVIRDSNTKQIVAMLREVSPNISGVRNLLSAASPVLGILNLGVSVINLGVSVIGFALILNKLKKLEESCKEELNKLEEKIKGNINNLHRKFDISVYANFRAALDLANDSQTMVNPENRINMATLAINRFLEAQHTYSNYIEFSLQENISLTDKYIASLALTYMARARCYLELCEINNAVICLQEGSKLIRNYVEQYVKSLLIYEPMAKNILADGLCGSNFIILSLGIHSKLESTVELSRLSKICKWLDSQLSIILDDEYILLEAEKRNLIKFIIISPFYGSGISGIGMVNFKPQKSIFDILTEAIFSKQEETQQNSIEDEPKPTPQEELNPEKVIQTVEKIEQIIETYHRFESYLLELQFIQQKEINLKDWLELVPDTELQEATSENIPIILLKTISENLA
jgi:hypothetical protein